MRAKEFITEDYKTAKMAFINQGANPSDIDQAINQYKQLVQKNQLQPHEKNIDTWPKVGFERFQSFVNQRASQPTTTAVKRQKVPGKSLTLQEDNNWLIVIPLDKNASCFHGRNSDWCTTKPNQNYFEEYFYDKNVVLIYCLSKQNAGMWAIAAHKDTNEIECFNKNDSSLTPAIFKQQTGLDPENLRDMALGKTHYPIIAAARNPYMDAKLQIEQYIRSHDRPDSEIEKLLLFTKDGKLALEYFNKNKTNNPAIWKLMVSFDGYAIKYLLDAGIEPDRELQLAAVTQDGNAIEYLLRAGIKPDREIQLAAVTQDGNAIEYLLRAGIKPDRELQLAAVTQNGYAIEYLLKAGIEPDRELQLAAVTRTGYAIKYLLSAGIEPDREIQLAAVTQNGNAIKYLLRAGIKPDRELQLAAVTQTGDAIEYLLDAGIKPDREIQLAAVTRTGYAIEYLLRAGIKPDREIVAAANRSQ